MASWHLSVVVLLVTVAFTSTTKQDVYMTRWKSYLNMLGKNETFVKQQQKVAEAYHRQQKVSGSPFPCEPLAPSPTVPTSVHSLRPGDIKVVGAMGDSLTAGFGEDAGNILSISTEYRGLAWSIGGEGTYEEQETLPNILKKYNPDLTGYSTGDGDAESENARFNVAESGSEASDLVRQAELLIERMKNSPDVDFENDWKMITIMSGGNDICDGCSDEEDYTPEKYIGRVTAALDLLHEQVPRAFVNLVEVINVYILKDLNQGIICTIVHVACACAAFPLGSNAEEKLMQRTEEYQIATLELAMSGRYDTRDDFTVVAQPFLNETLVPRLTDGEPDLSYFAPDCFHLSRKGHTAAANGLWNNLIQRVGEKDQQWSPGEPIDCPTEESPFFFTYKNSATRRKTPPGEDLAELPTANDEVDQIGLETPEHAKQNMVPVAVAFLALIVVGVVLTGVWLHKKRGQRRRYRVMGEEETVWQRPHTPIVRAVKNHTT